MFQRPQPNQYNPYFERYIGLVPVGDILDILKTQQDETSALLKKVSREQSEYRYDVDKWSLQEVVGHIADTERVMHYRLLVIARGDTTALPSFEENLYVQGAQFGRLNFQQITADLSSVRQSTLSLISGLSDEAWVRTGTASGHPTTPGALAYIIAGHELHHRMIIKERYLSK